MKPKTIGAKLGIAAAMLAMASVPAIATVKDGVDAWTRGDYDTAVKEWRGPAQKGDADAQFNLGQAYKMGRGVKTDLNAALEWYKKASAQGHLQAADSYGHLLHYQGRIKESLPHLQASSDRGDPRAQYLLATELFNGTNVQKDWVRAYALMTRASSAGMPAAQRSLSQMDQYVPLDQRQKAIVMAGELEQKADKTRAAQVAFPINTAPPTTTGKPVAPPPSNIPPSSGPPGFPSDIPAVGSEPPVSKPAATKPATTKTPVAATPVKAAAADGPWRIQLGAFSNEDNAQKLWKSLVGRIGDLAGLQPYLMAAGKVTRLQAGPFASKSAAETMCRKVKAAGQDCLAVPR